MWQNEQELMDACDGHYGEEAEEEALDYAEDNGFLDQWEAEEAPEPGAGQGSDEEEYVGELAEEFARVEQAVGRQLTPGEEQWMLKGISAQEQNEGVVPDLVEKCAAPLANARYTDEGRQHLAATAAQRAMDEAAGEGGQHTLGIQPPEPGFPDTGEPEDSPEAGR